MSPRTKEYLRLFVIMAVVTALFQYFIGSRFFKEPQPIQEDHSGERVSIPQSLNYLMPLEKEIDFCDSEKILSSTNEKIDTPLATYIFSNQGATLESFVFKHYVGRTEHDLSTIMPAQSVVKEDRCFLVALGNKTPYYFNLITRQDQDDSVILHYHGECDQGFVSKKFTVYKNSFKIDVDLTLEPHNNQEMQARLLLTSPDLTTLNKTDVISLLVNRVNAASLERVTPTNALFDSAWVTPKLFGFEGRYFIHSFVSDLNNYAQRGYVKRWQENGIIAFLEGPKVKEKSTWKLSFYLGPKEVTALSAVDERLTQVLDYGWFDAIARVLLYILRFIAKFTYNYGLAIIVLTLLIRLIMAPFMSRGMTSIKKQQEISKKSKYIEQKYKHDPEKLRQERAELLKNHGMPGLTGCLPLLLQVPIFMALYRVLSVSLELYQSPFLWINDLSARDPYFILPVLAGLSMVLSTPMNDPKQLLMMVLIGLVFSAFMSYASAGILLYLFVTTFFSVVQNMLQKRMGRS
ncbi:MAG TPA: YidC/Oxa1 family insertase periplasmic-domain containing protein [Candidatus Babeliales bacterium]|nr:YidC/Oxa1 family insertase periplasmic-domain containing protein [Candidatus Babeliales bacterium]